MSSCLLCLLRDGCLPLVLAIPSLAAIPSPSKGGKFRTNRQLPDESHRFPSPEFLHRALHELSAVHECESPCLPCAWHGAQLHAGAGGMLYCGLHLRHCQPTLTTEKRAHHVDACKNSTDTLCQTDSISPCWVCRGNDAGMEQHRFLLVDAAGLADRLGTGFGATGGVVWQVRHDQKLKLLQVKSISLLGWRL